MNNFPAELRRLRRERGLTQQHLARRLGVSKSLVASFESGRLAPQDDTATALDEIFGTGEQIRKAAAEARRDRQPWLRPWVDHEARATVLRNWQPLVIPGLLQTEDYARAILTAGPDTADQAEELAAGRLARQQAVFGRKPPAVLSAVIGEAALWCGADPVIMVAQLRHLIDVGQRPNVHVYVLPTRCRPHPGMGGAFALATLPDGSRVGYVDDPLEGRLATSVAAVGTLEVSWEAIISQALSPDRTSDLILRIVDEHNGSPLAKVDP